MESNIKNCQNWNSSPEIYNDQKKWFIHLFYRWQYPAIDKWVIQDWEITQTSTEFNIIMNNPGHELQINIKQTFRNIILMLKYKIKKINTQKLFSFDAKVCFISFYYLQFFKLINNFIFLYFLCFLTEIFSSSSATLKFPLNNFCTLFC